MTDETNQPKPELLDIDVRDSPAIKRLIEEIRAEQQGDTTRAYNRVYNRHMRS